MSSSRFLIFQEIWNALLYVKNTLKLVGVEIRKWNSETFTAAARYYLRTFLLMLRFSSIRFTGVLKARFLASKMTTHKLLKLPTIAITVSIAPAVPYPAGVSLLNSCPEISERFADQSSVVFIILSNVSKNDCTVGDRFFRDYGRITGKQLKWDIRFPLPLMLSPPLLYQNSVLE